ncbi:MAG: hypothetical protein HKN00_12070 [Flavobacteriaceae bacterium]|nr:hypothetical protein [Bacteroidia bacterium]MBT8288198.1 hypothetical protein [Bacteroidia bacterium]NNF75916.1 hypothetical protein [Flavobacteriaceae bacterium]NNK72334.1 hypothetical protein [Flavobacteriaceae bacterium]
MLGLLVIFFIGKYFYELAQKYNKNKWLYAILGIVVYYAAGAVLGVTLGLADIVFGLNIDWDNSIGLNLLGLPAGIVADYGFFYFLRKKWKNEFTVPEDEIMKIGESLDETKY